MHVSVLQPRVLCVYPQGFLGSGAHGNQRKHQWPPSPPPPRLPLLPIGFATAPKAGENGKLGSQRGPLLRKDNVSSAEHTRKVRTVGVFVL